jgi:hypothetical protein
MKLVVRVEGFDMDIKTVDFVLNRGVLLSVLIVSGVSFLFGGCLAFVFSDSLFTVFCSLIIGVTSGILLNYLILTSRRIVKKIDIELDSEAEEELTTVMKFD